MPTDIIYISGQLLGVVAVILGFVSFQMKTPGGVLIFQTSTALVFSAHYLLIGATSAMALNLFGAVKCLLYFFRDRRGSKSVFEPILFTVLELLIGIFTWEGWYSIFIVSGLAIDSISLALPDAQKMRYCMFVKSPLCLIYNAIVLSGGGVVYECAVLISSAIGIIKTRRKKSK